MMTTTMATLKGSEKQIAWATDIRERMIASAIDEATPYINDKARSVAKGQMTQAEADQLTAKWEIAIEMMGLEDTAKWWIDNRYKNGRSVRDSLFITPEMIAEHCAAKAAARAEAAAAAAAQAAEAAAAAEEQARAEAEESNDMSNDSDWPENYTCGSDMTVSDAIAYLATGRTDQASVRTIAIELVARALDIALGDDYDANYNEIYDWIEDGSFSGYETIASLAAEWRELDAQARAATRG